MMSRSTSRLQRRRGLLFVAVAFGFLPPLVAICNAAESHEASVNVADSPLQRADAPVVGAYYYPWYGVNDRPLEHDWDHVMRRKLTPPQTPQAGLYRSDDPKVISQHIEQSKRAGVDFWAVSWWGPDTATDRAIRNSILKHPDANQLRYAILYEATGRLGSFDQPDYRRLVDDFIYLETTYFSDPNYLRIDGRPVVFIYLTREYFRNRGHQELAALRERVKNVYIVGDDVFGGEYRPEWAKQFDAVTSYDIYGQSTSQHQATTKAVESLADNYANARRAANSVGTAFVPAVAPGYNDTAERRGHPGTARYLIDDPNSKEGDLFRKMIRQAALPHLDSACGRLMMVTSFNEWYEDSQIEPTAGDQPAASKDNSKSGDFYTGGDRYVDYGPLYLDILAEETNGSASAD
jgi:glycoprotein endo-alpha-1,2-mannosidase